MSEPDLTRQPDMLPTRENTANVATTEREVLQPHCEKTGEGKEPEASY